MSGAIAAAAAIGTFAVGLSPAAAVTGTITAVLDAETSVAAPGRLANSSAVPCGTSRTDGLYFYEVQDFTVTATGAYSFLDIRADFDAKLFIFEGDVEATPLGGAGCVAEYDDSNPVVTLTAGTRYQAVLTGYSPGLTGRVSYSWNGPGDLVLGKATLDRERALTLCAPGNDVPAGYTLREGTAKAETLTGTAGNDVIRGLGGNDTIRGLGGDDILCGGDGQDTIDGGDGNDFVFGEAGQDTLSGGAGDDLVDGGDGNDTLHGNAGADQLFGGADLDVLDGGAGNDTGTDGKRDVFRNIETRVSTDAPVPTTR